MLTPTQTGVVNHLTLIFPNHSREVIEKTVLHLDSLKEVLDEGQLLQRGIDLLLDRNVAEQFGSAIPQDVYSNELHQPEDIILSRTTDMALADKPVFVPKKPSVASTELTTETAQKDTQAQASEAHISVASDSDSGDVILTRTEPGDVIFTGSEEPMDVMVTDETSKLEKSTVQTKSSLSSTNPFNPSESSANSATLIQESSFQTKSLFLPTNPLKSSDSSTSRNPARLASKSSNINSAGVQDKKSGFGFQDIINKAVKDLEAPKADETDGNNITAELDKLNLPVSGPGVSAKTSVPSFVVSSCSTTPSLMSRTPSPWTDDDLPEVLPKALPSLPQRKPVDGDDLPDISWHSLKSAAMNNSNNNSKSVPDNNNLFFKEEKTTLFEQSKNNDLPDILPSGHKAVPNNLNIAAPTVDKSKTDNKVLDFGEQDVIEANKLTIQKTGSGYVVKNKAPDNALVGASTNADSHIIPETSGWFSGGNNKTVDTYSANNNVKGASGCNGDNLQSGIKKNHETVKKHDMESILGTNFSPNTKKSSTTPYKKDLTRKALAQRESSTPKAMKVNTHETAKPGPSGKTDIKSEMRAMADSVRTSLNRLVGRHNSGSTCGSNNSDLKKHSTPYKIDLTSGLSGNNTPDAKKQSTPYKVDLTRKTLTQRESGANSTHTKVTMYEMVASNTPGKHVYAKSETFSSHTDKTSPLKLKIKSHASVPVSGAKNVSHEGNLHSSQGIFSQRGGKHHVNLPHRQDPNEVIHHTRVTMYETPTKTTPNVDVLRRLDTDPLPATQTPNRQPAQATNAAPASRATTAPTPQSTMATPVPGRANTTPAPRSTMTTQAPTVSKPATVTIQSQHVITYSDNAAKPTVVIPKEQTVVFPRDPTMVLQAPEVTILDEPTMVLSGPEVTVAQRNDNDVRPASVEEPNVILTLERSAEVQRQQVVNEVLALFSDVELNFLQDLAVQHTGPYAVNNICNVLLENQYPKAAPVPKPKPAATATATATAPNPEPEPDTSIDYYTDFESEKLSYAEEDRYFNQAISQLSQDFRWLPNSAIRQVLGYYKKRYAPAFKELTKIWVEFVKAQPQDQRYSGKEVRGKLETGTVTKEVKFCLLKNRRPGHSPGPNRHPLLLKELAFISKKDADQLREADFKVAQELNEQMYEDAGQLIECGCCYGEYPFEEMIQCYEGHLFCQNCLNQYAKESVFGQGKVNLTCMTDECTSTFPKSQLVRALPSSVLDKYEDRMQEESLNLADLGDLVRCPHCDFAAIMDPGDKVFRCQMSTCMKETCRYCKEEWTEHFGKKCEEIEKKDETKLRLEYEEKMTQAKVRTCHRCKAQFCKEDGCNKMTCRCGAKMCYICRKPNINYDHFCRHPRDPGKTCTQCKDCSLWTNADEDDNRAVAEIQKAAEEARKQQGFTDEKLIGAPAEPPKKKQKTK